MIAKIFHRSRRAWPLLGKELLEQSARRQMYVIRVLYALVLFGAFCFYYMRHLSEGSVLALGRGLGPFVFLVTTQVVAIFLFLPPMMAGAIAQEKERETLGLLFLTDLTPWELVLQKYIGRLIPMLTLLFLSLPLLAVAYSLGGVSAGMLYYSAAELFLTCLWVGALSLECSTYAGSTFQALIRSWGFIFAFALCCTLGPFQFGLAAFSPLRGRGFYTFPLIFATVASLFPTILFLVRARQILEERAFAKSRNPFAQQFKQMDQYWKDMRKLLRAILRKRDGEAKALAQLVIQRELGAMGDRREWSLGGFLLARMQIPNVLSFAIIFGMIVLIALVANIAFDPKSGGAFYFAVGGLWMLALLTIPVQSANAVASERINERLGPILTTPLTSREILAEWLAPVERWTQFLVRPLLVVFSVEAIVKFYTQDTRGASRWVSPTLYLVMSALTIWIYPALARWSCLWIGLRIRSQIRALMTSFMIVVAWCFIPLFATGYLVQTGILPSNWEELLRFISPVTVIGAVESIGRKASGSGATNEMIVVAFIYLGMAAIITWLMRRLCLTRADHYLGRV